MTRRSALLGALVGALLASAPASAQQEEPIVIDHADELQRVAEADSLVYLLEGHVRVHRGPVRMRSDRATIYRSSRVADFERNVHFWDRTTEIYADRVVYEEDTDVATATGRVQLIDRDSRSQVTADTVRYEREDGLIVARPRPHAVLLPADSAAGGTPFDVYADEMRFQGDSAGSEVVAVRKVLIERDDLTAVGDSLHYDQDRGVVALRISPRVETAATYLTAERIDVILEGGEMNALVAVEGARAINKQDSIPPAVPAAFDHVSQTSFLEGDSLYIAFVGEGIDWLLAEGAARSLSYARESGLGAVETWSANYLMGERLRLSFRGDTLVQVVASGGNRGVYRIEEVRVGGPERRSSEPIPLPELAPTAGVAARGGTASDRRPRRSRAR